MLMSFRDELLIQRCVDDELSPPETRALLTRLDGLTDGWKSLACGLLEDRNLTRVLGAGRADEERSLVASQQASSGRNRQQSAPASGATPAARVAVGTRLRGWWSHPVTSLSLCAAIAFVGGMLIPDRTTDPQLAANRVVPGGTAADGGRMLAKSADNRAASSYSVQLQPDGPAVNVPVYRHVEDLVRSDGDNPLLMHGFPGTDHGSMEVQWMFVPVDDGRLMLIPVSEDTVGEMQ